MLPDLEIDDVLRLRKPHPCGNYDWKVVRLGADIGLECTRCGRRVLLPRRILARRLKTKLPKQKDLPQIDLPENGLSQTNRPPVHE